MEQPENNEKMQDLKRKVKFKIMSLKVKEGTEYAPELVRISKPLSLVFRHLSFLLLKFYSSVVYFTIEKYF